MERTRRLRRASHVSGDYMQGDDPTAFFDDENDDDDDEEASEEIINIYDMMQGDQPIQNGAEAVTAPVRKRKRGKGHKRRKHRKRRGDPRDEDDANNSSPSIKLANPKITADANGTLDKKDISENKTKEFFQQVCS